MLNFGNRLKQLRNSKQLTQQDLATLMGLSRATIAGYESTGKQPDQEKTLWLADYFNVSTDYLLGRTEDPNKIIDNAENEKFASEFGQILKDLRTSRNVSTENIAEFLGVPVKDIEMYEAGNKIPSNINLKRIALYFNVTLDYIFGKTKSMDYWDLSFEFSEIIGQKFSDLRKSRNINLSDLSKSINVKEQYLRDLENGKASMHLKTILKISEYFNVPMNYFLGFSVDPTSTESADINQPITIADWPAFLASLPEDHAMLFENTDYPDEEKIAIMEEMEKAKQKKLKKIEKFMQYPIEVIDDALIYAAFDAEQRKKMNDDN